MKKLSVFLLILLLCLISVALYCIDKHFFLCPIEYDMDMVIRADSHGNGAFGARRSGNRKHNGVDLFADLGTPILACRSGIVAAATENRGMGKYVIIRHFDSLTTIYGHLSELRVRKGEFIRQGEVVGLVGKTGNANFRDIQPHLHLEVRKNNIPQDPLEYLR